MTNKYIAPKIFINIMQIQSNFIDFKFFITLMYYLKLYYTIQTI